MADILDDVAALRADSYAPDPRSRAATVIDALASEVTRLRAALEKTEQDRDDLDLECSRRMVRALEAEKRVAELEAAMPSEDVRNLLRSAHCDDGGDSGYPGEVCAWLTRLDAARGGSNG